MRYDSHKVGPSLEDALVVHNRVAICMPYGSQLERYAGAYLYSPPRYYKIFRDIFVFSGSSVPRALALHKQH